MDITKRAAAIAEVQAKYDDYLMSFPNVVGTGIGYRQRKSQPQRRTVSGPNGQSKARARETAVRGDAAR